MIHQLMRCHFFHLVQNAGWSVLTPLADCCGSAQVGDAYWFESRLMLWSAGSQNKNKPGPDRTTGLWTAMPRYVAGGHVHSEPIREARQELDAIVAVNAKVAKKRRIGDDIFRGDAHILRDEFDDLRVYHSSLRLNSNRRSRARALLESSPSGTH